MQHPVGYAFAKDGSLRLTSFWDVLLNPFAGWQYVHTINGALLMAAYVIGGVGAFYLLSHRDSDFAQLAVRTAVIAGVILSITQVFPTGEANGKNVARYQPPKLASMEGLFQTERGAPLAIIGIPDPQHQTLIDPIYVPGILSYLTYGDFRASVEGLSTTLERSGLPLQ
jgi:cytochrome d ubiquinol oxidase subunit I